MIALVAALPLAFFFQVVQPPGGYTVAGAVVDSVTGAPLSKARVFLGGTAAPFTTDVDGKFRFDGVRAGKHQLAVERIGYMRQSFAQHSLTSGLSTAVVTGKDQATGNLVFHLMPTAVIEGYIRDASGEPVAGMTVNALRAYGVGKNRRLGGSFVTSTDDRGYYRSSMPAGAYAIVVCGHPSQEIASVQPMAYPVTFYPGSTDPSSATFLTVKPGEEARADMTLRAGPSIRITGEVPAAAGDLKLSMSVAITAPSLLGGQIAVSSTAYVLAGKFTFTGMAAGKYHLQLIRNVNDQEPRQVLGAADIEANSDPSNVSITLAPPQKISVHLTLRGQPRFPKSPLVASLDPIDGTYSSSAQIGADGKGVFPYVVPGRYALQVRMGSMLAVESVAVNAAAQSGIEVDVPETGSVDIEAAASTATVNVAGRIVRGGQPQPEVLAILVQRDTWKKIGIYRSDQSDSDGTFAWSDLPPGEYLAFAVEDGEPADYDMADALRALMPVAQPLTLSGAALQKVELKVLPLPK